jgi:exonuclease SbcC
MKPLKLTMQAFGPYAGVETIDFRQLGNRTMFVISGKTGSGKTTIFDGISFAIYGKASGEDRNGADLRSQFASDDLLTEVSLEFSLRQKLYRITRSPQQEKKKERGGGFTTLGAKAELYRIDENGKSLLLASNVREVDEKIKEIMIIDSNQFRQILMIPQGEFRKLLTSDSKEKEIILQRLFHTEMYKRIEEKLKEEATVLKNTVEDQLEKRNSAIRSIKVVEIEELKEYIAAGSVNDVLILPLLKAEIQGMATKLEQLHLERVAHQQQRDNQQQRLFEAEKLLEQMDNITDIKHKKEKLEGMRDTFKAKELDADLARKAALLESQEQICHRLKTDCDALSLQVTHINKRITQLTDQLELAEKEHQKQLTREAERKAAADQVNSLQHIRDDVQVFSSIALEVEDLAASLEVKRQQREKANGMFTLAEEKQKKLQIEREDAEKAQLALFEQESNLEKLKLELDRLQKLEMHNKKVELARQVLEKLQGAYSHSNSRFADGRALVEEMEQKWLHSQAAVLASALHAGAACPVCGSDHHPKPATAAHGFIPTEADLKAAREQASGLEIEKGSAEKAFIESGANVKALNETGEELLADIFKLRPNFVSSQLGETVLQTQSEQQKLQEEQKVLAKKLNSLEKIKSDIKKIEDGKEQVQQQLKDIEEDYNKITIYYTEKKTTLEVMSDKIPQQLRSLPAFEAKLKEAIHWQQQLIDELERAQKNYQEAKDHLSTEITRREETAKTLKQTEENLTNERGVFKNNLTAQGFENYQLYDQAKKAEHSIQQLEHEIRSYREELRSVTDRFAELSTMLQDIKKPDMDQLRKDFAQLNEEIRMADEIFQNLNLKKRDNQAILENVESLNEKMKELEERYKLVGHLYEISKGQNTYRVTFERFVLAAFLDDILAEANVRLNKMTSGRYRLLRKTDRSKGNVQSGLELLVLDAYTGQERHVKTLSGGESFKASLSLALGLADVVQNYAGGVSLETMFIDEGFGTLDPESLDQAIEALIDIQSSGRLVGIISHVPELKERIDARLEVIATQTGSKTEFYLVN